MTQRHTISELIKPKGFRVKDIRDYSSVDGVLRYFWMGHYDTMCLQIRKYGDFMFFRDLGIYLENLLTQALLKDYIYNFIVNEYTYRLDILVLMRKDRIK